MNSFIFRLWFLILGTLGYTWCVAASGVDAQQVVIGQNITLQSGKNNYGVEVQAGVQMLLKEVNRLGGVHGRRISLRTLDDDNQSAKATTNAQALIDEGAFILFG